jgi:predicted RecB family nuclease
MTTKITRDVLEGYLNCKYKGFLKLAGEQGTRSDYEAMLFERRGEVRLKAIDSIVARHQEAEVARNVPLTAAALKAGPLYVLGATLEDDFFCLHFDGLKQATGPSKLGDFHYVPMLFHEGEKAHKEQRLLLEILGLFLSRVQGRMPGHGVVWYGKECRAAKFRLRTDLRRTEQVLRDLQQLRDGRPPRLLLNDQCQQCEFRSRCHEQAVQEDSLSLLRGVGEKDVSALARKGILTLTQLAHTFRPRRKGKRQARRTYHRYHALHALAIRDRRIYVFGTPELPESPVKIYLDVEGVPDQGFVYLVGMVVVRQDETEERFSFWADTREQERDIFERFLAEVGRLDDFRVYCYGAYERSFLRRMRKAARRKRAVGRVLDRLVNVLSLVHANLYFPCHSNGLKDVAGCLGCSWAEPNASGLQSLVWRAWWEADHDERWRQKLLTYNMDDCAALRKVTDLVYAVSSRVPPEPGSTPTRVEGPPVTQMPDTEALDHIRKWGSNPFLQPDFAFINKRSHFDYQRDRVYVRATRKIMKKGPRKHRNRKLAVSRKLEITAEVCPQCKCRTIIPVPADNRTKKLYTKRAIDLVITPGKIRRRVIECHGTLYQCSQCSHRFLPPKYERLEKHFHGLRSWTMYGHVEHGFSFKALQALLLDSFGLHVNCGEIHGFKSRLAHHYRTTYQSLLKRILAGEVLHADETEVYLKSGKGYVWVFSGVAEVVFMYRPTREGDFLRPLLKDFHGVLVTDFYTAYDSLDCPQQKCLIHLMRDMNQDLLANPYDAELRSLTDPFGILLRDVVITIDRHGLKHRFLKRHEGAVDRYFQFVASQHFHSEAAEALRLRLLKYKDKLFTFIGHDAVSWNNNLAEYGIKRFAHYRKDTVGSLKETGIRDYLTLLSICHTCRIRGISFLHFLLSRQRDLDLYSTRRGKRPRSPEIETCPRGLLPTRLASLDRLRARTVQVDDAEPSEQGPT